MTAESDLGERQELNNEDISDAENRKKIKKQNGLYSPNAFAKKSKFSPLELLNFFKQVVADPDTFDATSESFEKLELIRQCQYQDHKIVLTKEIFERKLKPPITPAIFTKKNFQIKLSKPTTSYLVAFENYLNLVCQQYYKANFRPTELSAANEDGQNYLKISDEPTVVINKRPGRPPGRKPKARIQPQTEEGKDGGSAVKDDEMKLEKNAMSNFSIFYIDVLDTLVSPLKKDYPFEKWAPKEIATFESAVCRHGKQFGFIASLIGSKTVGEVIEFYFSWKNTSHYKIWKYYKNIENKYIYNSWL